MRLFVTVMLALEGLKKSRGVSVELEMLLPVQDIRTLIISHVAGPKRLHSLSSILGGYFMLTSPSS
jgi:hypothetical protein